MKVALVHDYLTQRGGAERVVLSMARLFPGAPIHTSIYDAGRTFPEYRSLDVRVTPLDRLPGAGRAVRALLPLYPFAFATVRPAASDLVISSSSGWAHGVRTGGVPHLVYCYTPARWLYRTGTYLAEGGSVPAGAGPLLAPVLAALRRWDQRAAARPDAYVAISQAVAERIERTYGRAAPVIHPPVETARIAALAGDHRAGRLDLPAAAVPEGPFWLVLSRFLPYKRVDVAVRAAVSRGERIVVVGDGPARPVVEAAAAGSPLVELRGTVDDRTVAALLAACTGLVLAAEEDFGLTPLEAAAAGSPTVALAAGGALETVADGRTGVLVPEASPGAIAEGMAAVASRSWDRSVLRSHAEAFSEERFHRELLAAAQAVAAGRAP